MGISPYRKHQPPYSATRKMYPSFRPVGLRSTPCRKTPALRLWRTGYLQLSPVIRCCNPLMFYQRKKYSSFCLRLLALSHTLYPVIDRFSRNFFRFTADRLLWISLTCLLTVSARQASALFCTAASIITAI